MIKQSNTYFIQYENKSISTTEQFTHLQRAGYCWITFVTQTGVEPVSHSWFSLIYPCKGTTCVLLHLMKIRLPPFINIGFASQCQRLPSYMGTITSAYKHFATVLFKKKPQNQILRYEVGDILQPRDTISRVEHCKYKLKLF